jgi:tetratricopeptide (TPR) repeat protein
MRLLAALLILAALAAVGAAQSTDPSRTNSPSAGTPTAEQYEDVEILRALLARGLSGHGTAHATPDFAAGRQALLQDLTSPSGAAVANLKHFYGNFVDVSRPQPHAAPVEGVILGGGMVFTVTLPDPGRDPMPSAFSAGGVSEWERARRRLRGEPDGAAPVQGATPSTSDVILQVLAENGRHLRMAPDNVVIVAVTFRGVAYTPPAGTPVDAGPGAGPDAAAPPPSPLGSGPQGPAGGTTARDYEMIGDLHLRQQQYPQARAAYEQVLRMNPDAGPNATAALYRKLAEVMLHSNQLDEAKALIERAVEATKGGRQPGPAGPAAGAARPASRVPARLVITVPKRLCDQVGAGQMTLEEFKKQAKVDYFAFGRGERK